MAERLVEVFLPTDQMGRICELIDSLDAERLSTSTDGDTSVVRILVRADEAESLIDRIQGRLALAKAHRIVVLPVQVSLPPRDEPEPDPDAEEDGPQKPTKTIGRVSRDELHEAMTGMIDVSRNYILFSVLSTVVAAVGMERSSPAIVIGAMVIAPLLGPNIALAFATTLADRPLAFRALRANAIGVLVSLGLSVIFALVAHPDLGSPEIVARTEVSLGDIALALASGIAGAIAFSSGLAASLVGVMVAVALLPPTVALGLSIGAGQWESAAGAALLLSTNVVCVNLAGVATFVAQGIRPQSWFEAERSRKATRWAISVWTILLLVLAGLILIAKQFQSVDL